MDAEEYLISDVMQLGCKTRKEAAIVVQVYLELVEVRKYWDVEYLFNPNKEKMYLTAKKSKRANPTIFLPIPTSEKVSFIELQKFMESVAKDLKSVCLVIINPDSTTVFYEVSEGLVLPEENKKKAHDHQGEVLDRVLMSHKADLQQAALLGLTLNLTNEKKT